MRALARFILRGPSQAALVVTATALLAVILMPLSWLSGGAVTLIVLHLGVQPVLRVLAIASLATALITWVGLGSPLYVVGIILFLWLPAWFSATVLRQTASLALTLQALAGLGLVAVLLLQLMAPELGSVWRETLEQILKPLMDQPTGGVDQQQMQQLLALFSRLVPGMLAVALVYNVIMGLILGRWWQAALFNPGGLRQEFNDLRLGKSFALVTLALLILNLVTASDLLLGLLMVVLSIYLLQGLAIMHGVIAIKKLPRGWLYGLYVLLFLVPQVAVILVIAGLFDTWIDLRKQLSVTGHSK